MAISAGASWTGLNEIGSRNRFALFLNSVSVLAMESVDSFLLCYDTLMAGRIRERAVAQHAMYFFYLQSFWGVQGVESGQYDSLNTRGCVRLRRGFNKMVGSSNRLRIGFSSSRIRSSVHQRQSNSSASETSPRSQTGNRRLLTQ